MFFLHRNVPDDGLSHAALAQVGTQTTRRSSTCRIRRRLGRGFRRTRQRGRPQPRSLRSPIALGGASRPGRRAPGARTTFPGTDLQHASAISSSTSSSTRCRRTSRERNDFQNFVMQSTGRDSRSRQISFRSVPCTFAAGRHVPSRATTRSGRGTRSRSAPGANRRRCQPVVDAKARSACRRWA